MTVTHAVGDIHTVDPQLLGTPGAVSLYIIAADTPAIVDTGSANSLPHILDALDTLDVERAAVEHVFVTHVHLDHAGGAGHLFEELPNATFYVHEQGFPYLTDHDYLERLQRSVDRAMGAENAYGEPRLLPDDRTHIVTDGETIALGDRTLDVIDAPGHAPHHFAVFDRLTEALFSIDAAGMYLNGELRPTTPPPGFDLETNLATIDRLRSYTPAINLYGHFGPGGDDAVAELDQYKSLLPEWVDVIDARRRDHGDDPSGIAASLPERWQSPTVHRDIAGILQYLETP